MAPTNQPVTSHQAPDSRLQAASWHLDAVFYELAVKSFFDSNGDGIGDFPGLIRKLDYIAELGATCIWLLPFFPSPWRDDGYDVADYRAVHPAHGTIEDFRTFLHEAHARGLRVAAEMVINHTSDRHPWFQAAREAPPGSSLRDFYVWSDTPARFSDAEVLFPEQRSNWSYDPVAKAHYWHRFFDHQPELNYDNPQVRSEMLRVLRFWADLGVDALCLNGAPYLVERDGTSCEHLPETHAVLREFRRELAAAYPGLVLEAGVNAWPSDARDYFGEGGECDLAPNLPLAQRLFHAVRQEDRHPIEDLLRQTPEPPAGCGWVTLLRNHDELTLSLATDEERDYLFREYAGDERMRRHAGILRRLAPLVENDRRRIELLFGLLIALPGSPVIYYGDEIGMGDNVFLGGRAGVRTPMQWTAERNAGFSAAEPAQLFAPPITDPVFGHQAVNVEAQRRDPSSLFHVLRRLIALRKASPTLSRGSLELLEPSNRKVLAFVRRLGDEAILVVANLARSTQPAELDLSRFAGLFLIEFAGGTAFPRIGQAPYLFTLDPYALQWFHVRRTIEPVASQRAPVRTEEVAAVPTIEVRGGPNDLFNATALQTLEREVLPAYLRSQRWFGGKARTIDSVRLADWGSLPATSLPAFVALFEVAFADGSRDRYFLSLAVSTGASAARLLETMRPWVLARLAGPQGEGVLHDALADDTFCTAILAAIGEAREFPLSGGHIRGSATTAFADLRGNSADPLPVVRAPATSSNTLVFFGRRLLLKAFRRLEAGVNPDYEIGRFLTEAGHFDRIPRVAGSLEYQPSDGGGRYTLAILQSLVPNQGDGWHHAIDELSRYYDRASARMFGPDPIESDPRPLAELIDAPPPPALLEAIDGYLHAAATLGRRTAEMHLALASDRSNPDFAPEPITLADAEALREEALEQGHAAFAALAANLDRLPDEIRKQAERLLAEGPKSVAALAASRSAPPQATKTRVHGDYHLGQVLRVESDYVILDFEGEPTRTVEERRAKFSPVRDVAGMLRSYHYAAYAGLFAFAQNRSDDFARLVPWAESWQQWVSAAFLRGYLETADGADFLPRDRREFAELLDRFMLAKALYELSYELNNRPDWVRIPVGGVLALLRTKDHEQGIKTSDV